MINTYVCYDLETTGLDPKKNKIIEIGAVKVVDGEIVDTYKTYVNPGVQLESRIIELTGITDEMLIGAPYIENVIKDFLDFVGDNIILGHNIRFDFSFIKRVAVNYNFEFENLAIDTLGLSRIFLSLLPKKTLVSVCQYFNIEYNPHRALDDALATSKVYQLILRDYYNEENSKYFEPKKIVYKAKKEVHATKSQIEKITDIVCRNNIELECDISRLTKNEASRIIDNLRAQGIS